MILKIQINQGWVYISDLYKVESETMTHQQATDYEYNKEFYCLNKPDEKDTRKCYVTVHKLFSRGTGLDKIIVTDKNQVYLMNDEGKTIERLN